MALVKLLVRDEENNRTLQLFLTPEQRDRACSDESYVEQLMQEHDLNKTEEARNYARLLSNTFRQKIFFEVTKDLPPLPRQIYPHELKDADLDEPIIYYPQPFSFPNYPIILYM